MALIIGITGGIGSGKTTVCRVFRLLGIPVFEADAAARQLMNTDTRLRQSLTEVLGEDIYFPSGALNKNKLAAQLFTNSRLRQQVNERVHPAVRREFNNFARQHEAAPYIIYEAAILFEGGFHEKMHFSVLVTAPAEQRIARVMNRNGLTEQQVRERMKSQWPEEKKRQMADVCLENDNRHMLIPEIVEMDKKLKTYGTIW